MKVVSKIQDITNLVSDAVALHLKDLVKEKLKEHADEVLEEVAKSIAENLAHSIESYNMVTGDVQVNIWLGPKDAARKLVRDVQYKVETK
jgi:prophage DNA circulation protein